MRLDFCVACGGRDASRLEHHHLVPRSAGGGDEPDNLITLCCVCHGKAHSHERRTSSQLTKAGLRAAKERGTKLGGNRGKVHLVAKKGAMASAAVRVAKANRRANDVALAIQDLQLAGRPLREIAAALNERNIPAPRGAAWAATQVMRVLKRARPA